MADSPFAIDLPYTENETLYLTAGARSAAEMIKEATKPLHQEVENSIKKLREAMDDINPEYSSPTASVITSACAKVSEARNRFDNPNVFAQNITEHGVQHAAKRVAAAVKVACTHAEKAATNALLQTVQDRDNATTKEVARRAYGSAINRIDRAAARLDEMVLKYDRNQRKTVLVVGAGVSGLMTAWFLLDKGYKVSIVAKEWAKTKDTEHKKSAETGDKSDRLTSQVAGALWEYPPGGCGLSEIEVSDLAYSKLEQYQRWAIQSFLFYDEMAASVGSGHSVTGKDFGARMKTLYQFFYHDPTEELAPGTPSSIAAGEAKERAMKDANQHYQKYRKIKNIPNEEEMEYFGDKLGVGSLKIANAASLDANDPWTVAIGRIQHESLGLKWGYRHNAPVIDTDTAMGFLMELVQAKGAVLETREIEGDLHLQERELMDDFQADIIVNASGLGARQLANDDQVFPVRGAVRRVWLADTEEMLWPPVRGRMETSREFRRRQEEWEKGRTDVFLRNNAVLVPAQYDRRNQPSNPIFIVPRRDDTLIVGSILQRNNWQLTNLTQDSPEVEMMWERARRFMKGLRDETPPDGREFARGLRPFSHFNVRVAADTRTNSSRVVHNYGHGGSGWTLAVGCAIRCVKLVEKILWGSEV